MSTPSSHREVKLIDNRVAGRPPIISHLYRDYPANELDTIEVKWGQAREQASMAENVAGLGPLEHEHWDWRNKAGSVKAGHTMLVAVECEGEAQGIMAVLVTPRPGRLENSHVVYVDYLESAPWNLRRFTASPRFGGVGTVLVADAVRLSMEMGLGGRVGPHSLPQAEAFYNRCGMSRVGTDPDYFDLPYYEYTGQQAAHWFTSTGESL